MLKEGYALPFAIFGLRESHGPEHQLIEAVRSNQMKLINTVLLNLMDLTLIKDIDGRTVLHLAILNNNSYAFHELI